MEQKISTKNNDWLVRFPAAAACERRLYCFPYAGGGPDIFRSWAHQLPDDIEVVSIQLPGRAGRYREAPCDNWEHILDALGRTLQSESENRPYAFFGHSLGARIAYELAHRLQREGRRPADLLVVSGCGAPGSVLRHPTMHDMSREDLMQRLREMNGVPADVLANRAIMALIEPVLRADLKLAETWTPSGGTIATPIAAFCGTHDDIDPFEDMAGWHQCTKAGFTINQFDAGHFFPFEEETIVLKTLIACLEKYR